MEMKFNGDMLTIKDSTGRLSIPVEKDGDFYFFPKKSYNGLCIAVDESSIYYCKDASVTSTTELTANNLLHAKRSLVTRVLLNIVDNLIK
jgi:hypothetical protein